LSKIRLSRVDAIVRHVLYEAKAVRATADPCKLRMTSATGRPIGGTHDEHVAALVKIALVARGMLDAERADVAEAVAQRALAVPGLNTKPASHLPRRPARRSRTKKFQLAGSLTESDGQLFLPLDHATAKSGAA
jgi:hypothetical protein